MAAVLVPVAVVAALLALRPYLADLAQTRAGNLAAQGRNDEALVENDLARTLEPVSTDVLLQRTGILQALGRTRDAEDAMRQALRLSPLDYVIWERAGIFQRDCWGDPGGARQSFARAVRLSGQRLTPATLPPHGPCQGSVTGPG
jgi:Flp pilus assembly protein TadD